VLEVFRAVRLCVLLELAANVDLSVHLVNEELATVVRRREREQASQDL
jgi:hypothetical protein